MGREWQLGLWSILGHAMATVPVGGGGNKTELLVYLGEGDSPHNVRLFCLCYSFERGIVRWSCDNCAVVEVIPHGSLKDKHLFYIFRCIHFAEVKYSFTLVAHHIARVDNDRADDLSHNRLSSFLSKVPEAVDYPMVIPLWQQQLG